MITTSEQLDAVQRGQLVALMTSEGWKILQAIFEAECEKFKLALLNVKPGNTAEIVERHALAKAAAQFVTAVINRLNAEMEIYHSAGRIDEPADITSGVLDIGDYSGEESLI